MAYTPGYYTPTNWLNNPPAQNFAQAPVTQGGDAVVRWVDGEMEAKAFQIPAGFPVGSQIALWDINDQLIYIKSLNQLGRPNPMVKVRYVIEEEPKKIPTVESTSRTDDFVTKSDLENMKNEILEMITSPNQNGSVSR